MEKPEDPEVNEETGGEEPAETDKANEVLEEEVKKKDKISEEER